MSVPMPTVMMPVPMQARHAPTLNPQAAARPDLYSASVLPDEYAQLPTAEFAFPGALRDRLVAAILTGAKTTTSCLRLEYDLDAEPLPTPGTRSVVIDSEARPVAVIELTDIRTVPLADIDLQHALDEGEGFPTLAAWRQDHEAYWHSPQYRDAIANPTFIVEDTTLVVAQRFRLVEDLRARPTD